MNRNGAAINSSRIKTIRIFSVSVLFILFFTIQGKAQNVPTPVDWSAFKFLIGEWVGDGGGRPGQGKGSFSYSLDVQETVLIRKNHSEFPAADDRPAFAHDDLMIIFQEHGAWKAEYFDNERHVIRYDVSFSGDSSKVIFTGETKPNMPGFRLSYSKLTNDAVNILFEMAPPNNNTAFSKYIEATAKKTK